MASIQQSIRDSVVYASGYLKGRSFTVPTNFSELYAFATSKLTSLVSVPLPFLSFLALPFFSGTSTTVSLVFFYLTWSAFVLSHNQLTVELEGTLAVRLLCFVLPVLGFLGFDCALPSLSKGIKNRGSVQSPLLLGRRKLLGVIGISLLNVGLGIALQAIFELVFTEILHLKSILKVTTIVPLPWTIFKDVAKGFVIRGILVYAVNRFLMHTLEDLCVFSGYAVLPSTIVLVGMARRTDEHFAVVSEEKTAGNFGRFGVLDVICGTTCQNEDDAMDDMQVEAEKHHIQERAQGGVNGAIAGLKGQAKSRVTRSQNKKGN
ncbi:hypothetical protein LTR37_017901 [Vermiconidia calcicola]|uniref:Uncharacterized protein n=1 Tax=Vermiconidia calcicola TaxID=1690605 RepID=A0ACC3MK60_9PEZI|nr:hypothetical protein LTR37_017901 [Vermiconidia calcicola]